MQEQVRAQEQGPLPKVIKIKRPKAPAPPQDKMSFGGFAENALDNLWQIAKGLVNVFPTALKSGAEVFGDPEGMALLAQNPEHLVQAFRNTASNLKDAIVEPYEKHGFRVLYEEPITPVLDAMTILSLGGAGLAKAGTIAKSEKLFKVGNAMKGIPDKIAAQIVKAPLKAVGINPETRQAFLRARRQEMAGAKLETGLRQERVLAGTEKLDDVQAASLEKLMLEGGTRAELAANPMAAKVYAQLDDWLKAEREAELGPKGRAFLTDKQMESRVIKEFAERKGVDFATGKQLYDTLDVKPLYAPAVTESAGRFDFKNAFMDPSVVKKGKVGFLERFQSAKGAAGIRTRIARAIGDFYNTRASLRLVDRMIQTPGYARAVKAGDVTLKELLPSQGVFQRYFTDRARSRSLFVSELEGKHGQAKAAQLLKSDPATQKAMNQAVNVAIDDPTLRKLISREFKTVGGDVASFVRVYDYVTNLFRSAATKLSLRWYTGNIIGDALLASMAGSNWPIAKRLIAEQAKALKLGGPDVLPRAIRSGPAGLAELSADRIPLLGETANKYVNKASDLVGAIDDASRAGIFTKAVIQKLKTTSMHFTAFEDAMRTAVAEVALAPDELADILVRNQQLGEHVARNSRTIQKLDAEIAKEQKSLGKLDVRFDKPNQKGFHPLNAERQAIKDRVDILMETRDAAIADLTKNMMQREVARIPELRRKAEIAEQAMDRANTFLGEYLGLGPIERGVFRRIVPFYAWSKAMAKLAFTFPFIAPGKAFFWHRYQTAMMDMMGDPELPEWMAAYAPVGVRQNGDTVWARITSLSPFGSLRTERIGGAPIPSILAFWQANPWISTGYKLIGGKDMFSAGTVPYGEHVVSTNDGTVWKFNAQGKIEKTIEQPPLIRSLAYTLPVVQMVDQIYSNYDVRKGIRLNPDGTVKYPLELHQRLADAVGLKLMHGKREVFIRSEKARVRRILDNLMRSYPRASPEEREYIRVIREDVARGEYRRIEARQ